MKPLCIAHCESSINMGGQELRILDLMARQNAHGHKTMLLARPESPIFQEAKARHLRVHGIDFRNSFNLAAISMLTYRVIHHAIDILDCHSFRDAAISLWMKPIGCKLVWSIFTSKFYKRDRAHKLQWRLGPHATIAASDHIKQTLIDAYSLKPDSITVIGEAVDTDIYCLSEPLKIKGAEIRKRFSISAQAPLYIQVGMIRPDKQQPLVVEAMETVWKRLPEAHLIFVGEATKPSFRKNLESAITASSQPKQIHITGFESDPRPYYAAADIVVLASQAEARSRVITEAQAMMCLIVAPRIGGIPEVIEDNKNGFLYEGGNSQALAACMLDAYFTDADHKAAIRAAGRLWATTQASPEAQYEATLAVYQKVLTS